MGREIKRVPLDFSWPQGKVWEGYVMPKSLELDRCPACDGSGLSPGALAMNRTFYAHNSVDSKSRETDSWKDKISQLEVDNLMENNRLPKGSTAEKVNEANRAGWNPLSHDCLNRHVLVTFRCERIGINPTCSMCNGSGSAGTPEQRAKKDAWERTDPAVGDGWQVWENVSEGSPVSPVFSSQDGLIEWLVGQGYSLGAAVNFTRVGYAPSLLVSGGRILNDIESCSEFRADEIDDNGADKTDRESN